MNAVRILRAGRCVPRCSRPGAPSPGPGRRTPRPQPPAPGRFPGSPAAVRQGRRPGACRRARRCARRSGSGRCACARPGRGWRSAPPPAAGWRPAGWPAGGWPRPGRRRTGAGRTALPPLPGPAASLFADLQRGQAAGAQLAKGATLAVRLQGAGLDPALGVGGFVAEGLHQASRVTRRISSRVVEPLAIQRSPSSRMLRMPAARAASRRSCSARPW